MVEFLVFSLFILCGVALLVIWPILLHPTLPPRKKWIASLLAVLVLVPLSGALYLWLGVPPLAAQ